MHELYKVLSRYCLGSQLYTLVQRLSVRWSNFTKTTGRILSQQAEIYSTVQRTLLIILQL